MIYALTDTSTSSGGIDAGYAIWIFLALGGLLWFLIDRACDGPAKRKARREHFQSIKAQRDAQLRCPHCGVAGMVVSNPANERQGIHGGKATAAILTGGVSLPFTGLSLKKYVCRMHCRNCWSVWVA